jgi:hypothetical protein
MPSRDRITLTPIDGPNLVSCGNYAKDPSNLTEILTVGLIGARSSLLHRTPSNSSPVVSDLQRRRQPPRALAMRG